MLWVLIIGLGASHPTAISSISTEESCVALGEKLVTESKGFVNYGCYSYRSPLAVKDDTTPVERKQRQRSTRR